MAGKRALIVDDSRSARVILGRMLESFGLVTDSAESAEQAFEYLQTGRPDVIFMDHLMPGMDGFAAVKLLKSNPDTATIPVLMYTSQEGELYMGQARALGAVGVLPKTVKPMDLTRMLHQLHLLPDRRQVTTDFDVAATATGSHAAAARQPQESDGVRLHEAEIRNYISNSFEALARRIATDVKAVVSSAPLAEAPAAIPPPPAPFARKQWPLWLAAGIAALACVVGAIYMNRELLSELQALNRTQHQLAAQLSIQQQQLTAFQNSVREWRNSVTPPAATAGAASSAALLQAEVVPYGETPLSGARLERLRALIERLAADRTRGVLRIDHYTGDFCLTGNMTEGYSEATEDTLTRRCDLVGNPFDDALGPAQRSSVAFANYLNTIPRLTAGNLQVAVNNGGRKPSVSYPAQSQTLTAGEWNRVAARNNRVEFSLLSAR